MILTFAWRYFKGKKSTQAIQIISWVSVMAMAVGTASLLIVLSVFNGFEDFIKKLYSDFYPQVKVSPQIGKTFEEDSVLLYNLKSLQGIKAVSKTLDEKVLLAYEENQVIVTLKGVDSAYNLVTQMKDNVRFGKYDLASTQDMTPIVLGLGISNRLGASDESVLPIACYSFKKESSQLMDIAQPYNSNYFTITGVFALQEEIDNQYALASLELVQELSENESRISAYEVSLLENSDQEKIVAQLKAWCEPKNLKVETRYEQNKTLYFILSSERWAVYAILTLMLLIASFNIIGSLSMLVIDKQKDIAILKTMGMENVSVQRIFLSVGVLLSLIGATIGSLLALIICLLQQYFGFVKLGGSGSFLIEAYPVKLKLMDFVLVLVTVIIISLLASLIPSIKASRRPVSLRSSV
jgi:lipoprotein-releasing system permease protein